MENRQTVGNKNDGGEQGEYSLAFTTSQKFRESFRQRYAGRRKIDATPSSDAANVIVVDDAKVGSNVNQSQGSHEVSDLVPVRPELVKQELIEDTNNKRDSSTVIIGNSYQMSSNDDNKCTSEHSSSFFDLSYLHCSGTEELNPKTELEAAPNSEHGRSTSPGNLSTFAPNCQSATDTTEGWIDMVSQKLNELNIYKVVKGTSEKVLSSEEFTSIPNLRFRMYIKYGLKAIWQQVQLLESKFNDDDYLPHDQMSTRLQYFQDAKNIISDKLPQEIYKAFLDVFDRFAEDYQNRNEEMLRLESTLMNNLLDIAVQDYCEQMKLLQVDGCVDINTLHSCCQEETERKFIDSASFKCQKWEAKYTTELRNRLRIEKRNFEKESESVANNSFEDKAVEDFNPSLNRSQHSHHHLLHLKEQLNIHDSGDVGNNLIENEHISKQDANETIIAALQRDLQIDKVDQFEKPNERLRDVEGVLWSNNDKVDQGANAEESCTSTLNNLPTSTSFKPLSDVSVNHDWIEMVSQTLNKLQISQVVEETPDDVLSVEDISGIPNPIFRSNIKVGLRTIWRELKTLDCIISKAIYITDDQMSIRVKLFHEARSSIPERLPQEIQKSFMDMFNRFAAEYKKLNQEIQRMESTLMGTILDKAVQYYSEEMQFVLGETYVDSNSFHCFRREIQDETERLFLEAAGLAPEWAIIYKIELSYRLQSETEKFEKQNEAKKAENERLKSVINDCVRRYQIFIESGKKSLSSVFGPRQKTVTIIQTYNNIILKSYKNTFEYFYNQTDKLELHSKVKSFYMDDLVRELAQLLASQLTNAESIQNDLKATEETPKNSQQEFPENSENSTATTTLQLHPEVRNQDLQTGPFPDKRLWSGLPRRELLLHFGCERTLAGIVLPETAEIIVLYEVQNCLNFGQYQLLVYPDEYKSSCNLMIPNLIERTAPLYELYSSKFKKPCKVEELIAALLLSLKCNVELEQQVEVVSCTICVPQSFNYCHRKVIEDAAHIARLENVTFINDTTAIALAFMMQEQQRNASVVVVNTSEGFIDCAYFKLDNGLIVCDGVTGDYFQEEDQSLLKNMGEVVYKMWDPETRKKQKIGNLLEEFLHRLKNSDDLKQTSSCVILCGCNTDLKKLTAEVVNQQLWGVDIALRLPSHQYPLMGAGYRAGLNASKPDNDFCKRWINSCGDDISFLALLVSQLTDQLYKDKKLSKISKQFRVNLSNDNLRRVAENFVLRERYPLHACKMYVLKKLCHLEECVQNSSITSGVKAAIISRCSVIRSNLLIEVPFETLFLYLQELDECFMTYFPPTY